VTERWSAPHGLDLPPEPVEIVAGPVQLRPWEPRLAAELATLHGWAEPDAVGRRLREWRTGVALSFAVQESTTARLLGEVVLRPLPDAAAEVSCRCLPHAREAAGTALDAVSRWATGALGATRVVRRADPERTESRAHQ
jgi:hypothetical protein